MDNIFSDEAPIVKWDIEVDICKPDSVPHQVVLGAGYPEKCPICKKAYEVWLEYQKQPKVFWKGIDGL